MLFIYFIVFFIFIVTESAPSNDSFLGVLFIFAPWVAIGLRIYSSGVGKNFLCKSEINELKKCLYLREFC